MSYCRKRFIVVAALLVASASCAALPCPASASPLYQLSPGQDMVGETSYSTAQDNDTLLDIARDYDLGYSEITAANPGVDPWLPEPGSSVLVPAATLLPSAEKDGIVVNLAEMRLYYFYEIGGVDVVVTYPIGVGREGCETPLGAYRVTGKVKDPCWFPPASIRNEKPGLPKVVPPGPDNPLGGYKITLSAAGYLLHGTNHPWGVGRRVSHGCIRLYPEDVARLYPKVRTGTPVTFVYQPVKAGMVEGRIMLEVHEDYLGGTDLMEAAIAELGRLYEGYLVSLGALETAVREMTGVPVDISATPSPAADIAGQQ